MYSFDKLIIVKKFLEVHHVLGVKVIRIILYIGRYYIVMLEEEGTY